MVSNEILKLMHTIEIEHRAKNMTLPEYLGEFTNTQYIQFCILWVEFVNGRLTYGALRIKLLYKLSSMLHSGSKLSEEDAENRNFNVYNLSLLMDDYFTDEQHEGKTVKNIDLTFVDNKIPIFTHQFLKYYGPDEALLNISFDEFIEANGHFKSFAKTKDEQSLNMLIATLYRPKKLPTPRNIFRNYDGDKRQDFVEANVNLRAKKLKNLPYHIKYGIYLFFMACQNYIATATEVEVDGNICDFSILFKKDGAAVKGIGMPGLLFSLAETKVFGNKKETGKERYWNILLRLYQNHLTTEELKQQRKNVKTQ